MCSAFHHACVLSIYAFALRLIRVSASPSFLLATFVYFMLSRPGAPLPPPWLV